LQQGDILRVKYGIENLSWITGDSLLLKYTISDNSNSKVIKSYKIKRLAENEIVLTEFKYSTNELKGGQNFRIEVNPEQDQPELTILNNYLFKDFYINIDKLNPILDVTFD